MKIANYQNIPFHGNTPDNTHCHQAGMKMVLGFFFPEEEHTWEDLEKITGKRPGKWTWPTQGWLYLAKRELEVTYYGTFNYREFVLKGGDYLVERYGHEVGSKQIANSDLNYEISVAKELLGKYKQVMDIPTIQMIKDFIAENCLLLCNVNYYPLYGKSGYAGHFVLIYGIDDEFIYLQDPGLPPNPNAKIPLNNFLNAWNYSGEENKGLTVVRRMK